MAKIENCDFESKSQITEINFNEKEETVVAISNGHELHAKNGWIVKRIKLWAESSTIHGVQNVLKSEYKLVKGIWLTCLLASSCLCMYVIVQSIISYLQFDGVINLEIVSDITDNFPTISVCNLNPFLTNRSIEYVDKILNQTANLSSRLSGYSLSQSLLFKKLIVQSYLLNKTEEFRQSLGHGLDFMMISCLYGAAVCTAGDFEWYYTFDYGNCYKFNSRAVNPRIATRAGQFYGLRLELFVDTPDTLSSLSSLAGAHIFIHNFTHTPLRGEGLDVPVGVKADVSFSKKFRHRLASPYSDCVQEVTSPNAYDSEMFRQTIEYFTYYQRRTCLDLCFQKYITDKCQCYSAMFAKYANFDICSSDEQIMCSLNAEQDYYASNDEFCTSVCPTECNTVEYEYLTSLADFPSRPFGDALLQDQAVVSKFKFANVTFDDLKRRVLSVNLFYSTFDYSEISELESTKIVDLLSSMGGTLGLFIGVSILSFVEIVELIFVISRKIISNY